MTEGCIFYNSDGKCIRREMLANPPLVALLKKLDNQYNSLTPVIDHSDKIPSAGELVDDQITCRAITTCTGCLPPLMIPSKEISTQYRTVSQFLGIVAQLLGSGNNR